MLKVGDYVVPVAPPEGLDEEYSEEVGLVGVVEKSDYYVYDYFVRFRVPPPFSKHGSRRWGYKKHQLREATEAERMAHILSGGCDEEL